MKGILAGLLLTLGIFLFIVWGCVGCIPEPLRLPSDVQVERASLVLSFVFIVCGIGLMEPSGKA